MINSVHLKIADVVIRMESRFPLDRLSRSAERERRRAGFSGFFCRAQKPDIRIKVEVAGELPPLPPAKEVFLVRHFEDGAENWRLFKRAEGYLYLCRLEGREQLAEISGDYSRVKIFVLAKKRKGAVWDPAEVVYDFLQVLLFHYLADGRKGIVAHSCGIRDSGGKGLLFAGKSGAGKTTIARFFDAAGSVILNDDRIGIRKTSGGYTLYSTPWHGEFADYLAEAAEPAKLSGIFFVSHSAKNKAEKIPPGEAFPLLYQAFFPVYWDRRLLSNQADFIAGLVSSTACRRLRFAKNKKVVDFVRLLRLT